MKQILRKSKKEQLEVEPYFSFYKVVFHPLPKNLVANYKEGDEVEGKFGVERPMYKNDIRGVPIYISYFIPK